MNLAAWTEERIETLRTLHNEGKSAGDIAAILGNTTRNAVMGKKDRLGLVCNRPPEIRNSPVKRIRKPRPAPAWEAKPPPMLCEPVAIEEEIATVNSIVTFAELQPHHCRWPIGLRDYVFCGRRKIEWQPYCASHCRIAFRPGG
jgi:GcrA cell cycle regulator